MKFILNEDYLYESKADEQKLIDFIGEDNAKRFFALKQRLKSPENDLYYWLKKDKQELLNKLDELESTQTRSQKSTEASKGAELIYDKDDWKVYHITTYEASVKYGKHTQWCISGSKRWSNGERGEEYFNDYTSRGIKFYFYIKSDDEKYALALANNDHYEVYNQADDDVTDDIQEYHLPNVSSLPQLHFDIPDPYIYDGERVPDQIRNYIKNVVVEDGVMSISEYAFIFCDDLTSITIPDSVTSIERFAFEHCDSLASITIPDSVTSIGDNAFGFCNNPTSIAIPDSVITIGSWAFDECESLKDVYYSGSEEDWEKIKIDRGNSALQNANIHFNSRKNEVR